MKTFGRLALIAALAITSTAPAMAEASLASQALTTANTTRPTAVSYDAPTAIQGAVITGKARVVRKTGEQSQLFGGAGFFIAFLTALGGAFGYSSLKNFLDAIENGTLGQSPY